MAAHAHDSNGSRLLITGIVIPNHDRRSVYTCTQTLQNVAPATIVRTANTDSFICPICRHLHHTASPFRWFRGGGRGPLPTTAPTSWPPAPPIDDEPRKPSVWRRLARAIVAALR